MLKLPCEGYLWKGPRRSGKEGLGIAEDIAVIISTLRRAVRRVSVPIHGNEPCGWLTRHLTKGSYTFSLERRDFQFCRRQSVSHGCVRIYRVISWVEKLCPHRAFLRPLPDHRTSEHPALSRRDPIRRIWMRQALGALSAGLDFCDYIRNDMGNKIFPISISYRTTGAGARSHRQI